jgi:hypothetical protein
MRSLDCAMNLNFKKNQKNRAAKCWVGAARPNFFVYGQSQAQTRLGTAPASKIQTYLPPHILVLFSGSPSKPPNEILLTAQTRSVKKIVDFF